MFYKFTLKRNARVEQETKPALTFNYELAMDLSKIEDQNGSTCKLTAIANLDRFYSNNGQKYLYLPVHKGKRHTFLFHADSTEHSKLQPPAAISLRQIAKQNGSVQGELLEINQLTNLLKTNLGYQSEVVALENIVQFRAKIIEELAKNQPIIAFFNANDNGLPLTRPMKDREHACLITGYYQEHDEIRITHWGKHFRTSVKDFFESNQQLSATREPELYKSYKTIYAKINKFMTLDKRSQIGLLYLSLLSKYFDDTEESLVDLAKLISKMEGKDLTEIISAIVASIPSIKTATPKQNSGFKGKIICTEAPTLEKVQDMQDIPERWDGIQL